MSFRTKHWVLGASILAASALIAGCGGSDEMEEEPPPPVEPTVAAPILDKGYTSFTNLSTALLDEDDRTVLMEGLYGDGLDGERGVTSSLTTHEEPFGAEPLHRRERHFCQRRLRMPVPVNDDDAMRAGVTDPVLVDEDGTPISHRSATFEVGADWDRNPAAEWMTTLMGSPPADPLIDDMWTFSFDSVENGMGLDGGRTLHLDLRSDYTPNMTMMSPDDKLIARGPASKKGGLAKLSVNWTDIMLEDIHLPLGGEIDLGEEGIRGSYKGIQGMFTCAEGGLDDEQNICRINHHTMGKMNVSEDDMVNFTPNVYTSDTNWLAAGVWLTIPDDEAQGDYAIGAFVYGNDPYEADSEANAQAIMGTATYTGQAFGRFAESNGGNQETGRFTANAALIADFGDTAAIGTIDGDVTGFMANGEARQNWDVNFEQAMIHDADRWCSHLQRRTQWARGRDWARWPCVDGLLERSVLRRWGRWRQPAPAGLRRRYVWGDHRARCLRRLLPDTGWCIRGAPAGINGRRDVGFGQFDNEPIHPETWPDVLRQSMMAEGSRTAALLFLPRLPKGSAPRP